MIRLDTLADRVAMLRAATAKLLERVDRFQDVYDRDQIEWNTKAYTALQELKEDYGKIIGRLGELEETIRDTI